ncbi:MAG: SPASM domain-containing protein [Deltaproteobacteria bacterium]|nr:SPASM domain-containing protein [Deltaproteobacteria bacterium]MBN2846654.1 SPASM domain-containing protein [Deltaproteobacteria bacterium]
MLNLSRTAESLRYAILVRRAIRAYDPGRRTTNLPGPFGVRVQTVDRCNQACLMCPYSILEKPGPPNYIDDALYAHILNELKKIGTVRYFTPMLQDEPLVDKNIHLRIEKARATLGDTPSIYVVTNGVMLNPRKVDDLIAAGVDLISVSIDAVNDDTYEAIHGSRNFGKVRGNVRSLLHLNPRPRVEVRFLKQRDNAGEERDFARYWKGLGADLLFHRVVNRAGTLSAFEEIKRGKRNLKERLFLIARDRVSPFCPLPFYFLNILWNGEIILCCNDWGPQEILGDISRQSLSEVWNGSAMNRHRHLLYQGANKKSQVCKDCSYGYNYSRARKR